MVIRKTTCVIDVLREHFSKATVDKNGVNRIDIDNWHGLIGKSFTEDKDFLAIMDQGQNNCFTFIYDSIYANLN